MKKILSVILVSLSFNALSANLVDTQTFTYDGSQDSVELILRTEKTHTEYRDEPATCYRNEIIGYSTVCTGGYGPGYPHPYPGPSRRPYPGPGPYYPGPVSTCYQQPIYRSVPYSCMRSTPYQVKDYDVEARVIVDVTNLSEEVTPGEKITVTLIQETLRFEASGSKKFFITQKKRDIRSSMYGSVKMIDALLAVELIPSAPILKAVKVSDIAMKNSVLSFNIGEVSARKNLGFSLKIEKKKLMGSDTVLMNRTLEDSEVEVNATSAGAQSNVDVKKLGLDLTDGKFEITATTFAKVDGQILNEKQFDKALSASRTLIYKVR